jgi:hypothetical protein
MCVIQFDLFDGGGQSRVAANLESWKRIVRLGRTRNPVEVADEYSLNHSAKKLPSPS